MTPKQGRDVKGKLGDRAKRGIDYCANCKVTLSGYTANKQKAGREHHFRSALFHKNEYLEVDDIQKYYVGEKKSKMGQIL